MQYSQKKHVCWSLFLIKLQSIRPATLSKRGSNIGVFLWLLQNFWEQQFRRTSERCSVIKRNRWNVIINFHVFMRKMYYKYAQSNSYRTARKTIFSFSKRFENMVFPKKIALEYISCIIRKDDISFSRKYDLILDTKWKMIFLKKKTKKLEIWYFLQMFWKDGLSRKFVPEHNIYFFQKIWYFCFGRKMKEDDFIIKRVEIWYFLYIYVGVTSMTSPLPQQKDKDALVPKKYT